MCLTPGRLNIETHEYTHRKTLQVHPKMKIQFINYSPPLRRKSTIEVDGVVESIMTEFLFFGKLFL